MDRSFRKLVFRPYGCLFYLWNEWDSKERPDRREGKKVSGGHFFSSWENPWAFYGIPQGCWQRPRMIRTRLP